MAGAGKKTFVAGEVLTAQDVNSYLGDQAVMVFDSSAARSSAIPTPTEGMTTYLKDKNQIESFDGAEYRGMSGLQLVKKQAIGTAVSSVTVTDAFSATYDNYKIVVSGGTGSLNNLLALKMGTTATGYYSARVGTSYVTGSTFGGNQSNSANWIFAGHFSTNTLHMNVDLLQPFLAKPTSYNSGSAQTTTTSEMSFSGGFLDNTTSYTAFDLVPAAGTLTGGTIYVYGYGT